MDLYALLSDQLGYFMIIFVRISGIFIAAPVFGSRNFPVYAKAGLSLLLSFMMFPLLYSAAITIPSQLLTYGFILLGELLIGIIIGYVSSFVFSAVQMAGQLLDMQIGFGVVNVIDPQFGQQVPLVGNFKYILALLVFLATNGHHILLGALFASFTIIPVTTGGFSAAITGIVVDMVFGIFVTALKISLPVFVALVLTDIALGILARTMPQMNIFIVGIPGKIFIGLFVLTLAMPFYIAFLEVGFNDMYKDIYRLLGSFSRT